MAIKSKRSLGAGVVLTISFLIALFFIFSPVFGEGRNGLEYADEMFNKLSKGSSYFIPKLRESNKRFVGKMFSLSIKMEKPEEAEKVAKLLTTAGAMVDFKGSELKIEGDLGKVLAVTIRDADTMYHNRGAEVAGLYGYEEKEVMKNWWNALGKIDKQFKKEKKIEESKIVSDINKKAVETAYNYYGVQAEKVKDKVVLMSAMLVFYVAYTMWWGFAILYLFEGVGLSMTKPKVRKEV